MVRQADQNACADDAKSTQYGMYNRLEHRSSDKYARHYLCQHEGAERIGTHA